MRRRHKSPVRAWASPAESKASPTSQGDCLPRSKHGIKALPVILHTASNHSCGTMRPSPLRDHPPASQKILNNQAIPKKRFLKQAATHCRYGPGDSIQTFASESLVTQRSSKDSEVPDNPNETDVFRADVSSQQHLSSSATRPQKTRRHRAPEIHRQMGDSDVNGPQITQPALLPTWQTFQGLWQNFLKEREKIEFSWLISTFTRVRHWLLVPIDTGQTLEVSKGTQTKSHPSLTNSYQCREKS